MNRNIKFPLSTRIAIVIFALLVIAFTANTLFVVPRVRSNSSDIYCNYALSLAETAAQNISSAAADGVQMNSEVYKGMLGGIKIKGVSSSYVYMMNSEGVVIYHPNESVIGEKGGNEAIDAVIREIQAGKEVKNDTVIYDYRGASKLAGYAVTSDKSLVVVAADYDEVLSDVDSLRTYMVWITVFCVIVMTLAGAAFCRIYMKPIGTVTQIIDKVATLDFSKDSKLDAIAVRTDELGLIGRSVNNMRENLESVVYNIEESSKSINGNFDELQTMMNNVSSMCEANSATTEELAAGMQENAATARFIKENLEHMQENADQIDKMAEAGNELSKKAKSRAQSLKEETVKATEATRTVYEDVQVKANEAIENAKNVDKINALTETIKNISSQTSLLALNASIEAARAGEVGKGFAVVASEISNLATQTENAIADIEETVGSVVDAVDDIQECLRETTTFIGRNVLDDYEKFKKVSEQYDKDANDFNSNMNVIKAGVTQLNTHVNEIAETIGTMNATIDESALGISEMAENTSKISGHTQDTSKKVRFCKDYVKVLDDVADKFVLDNK